MEEIPEGVSWGNSRSIIERFSKGIANEIPKSIANTTAEKNLAASWVRIAEYQWKEAIAGSPKSNNEKLTKKLSKQL